eukprot:CAMPEP_0194026192 /NCGR_PEP_ID=MMETSP0009_2-20130614/501_1 /TAXON_ID=210454 /ORGANISM="Grammatophora oceanica, Strain CCMP 410" /LENGTH=198 /DNA_ID=CAMNT_0038664747 /DNA_START=107 /DNA_END=703 /DNA_ORIENTATION=+
MSSNRIVSVLFAVLFVLCVDCLATEETTGVSTTPHLRQSSQNNNNNNAERGPSTNSNGVLHRVSRFLLSDPCDVPTYVFAVFGFNIETQVAGCQESRADEDGGELELPGLGGCEDYEDKYKGLGWGGRYDPDVELKDLPITNENGARRSCKDTEYCLGIDYPRSLYNKPCCLTYRGGFCGSSGAGSAQCVPLKCDQER